jgi:hypothetical protein
MQNDKRALDVDKFLKGLQTYIDGKMKRYNLLFAVNGGAFALAKFMKSDGDRVLGGLELWQIALGAIIFTVLMTIDIWLFAKNIKGVLVREDPVFENKMFGRFGKIILVSLCVILILGWVLAGFTK